MTEQRVVIDTNIIVSALIYPGSTPGKVLRRGYNACKLVFTPATMEELIVVLERKKFAKLFTAEERKRLLESLHVFSDIVPVTRPIAACRDPGDDKFLEAAVHGRADCLITGDDDLLALHPFMGIPIMTAAAFLLMNTD